MKKGFTLLEVIIAFIIAFLGLSAVYISISFITNIISKFTEQDFIEDLILMHDIYIAENLKMGIVKSKTKEEIKVNLFKTTECIYKEYKTVNYKVCIVKIPYTYANIKGWKFVYENNLKVLLTVK